MDIGQTLYVKERKAWRKWLKAYHARKKEIWLILYKKESGKPRIPYNDSVEEALCFGWIDGVRKSLGPGSYVIRFTPRRNGSTWSTVNTRRARALIEAGRMQPAGLRAFEARDARKSGVYSFEQRKQARLAADAEERFKANAAAWRFFESQPPGYRGTAIFWVMSAKQEATRARRLETLIADSEAGRRIGLLRRE